MRDSHLTWCRTPLPAAVPRMCPHPPSPALQTDQTTRMREQTESPERWVWETASGQDCLYSEVPEGKRKVRALEDVREGSSPGSGRRRGARGLLGSVRAPRPCTHTHTHTTSPTSPRWGALLQQRPWDRLGRALVVTCTGLRGRGERGCGQKSSRAAHHQSPAKAKNRNPQGGRFQTRPFCHHRPKSARGA